jgi:cupin 2 domain-containing protein
MAASGNLFAAIPSALPDEFLETLATGRATAGAAVRIERIVSKGHASPAGFWYDQHEAEWVAVLSGEARLRFEESDRVVSMKPGDMSQHSIARTASRGVDCTGR